MDSKTKYKILGVFVALGLVVILYPFFQNGEEVPSTSALVNPPAFPEQTTQISANDSAAPVATAAEPALQPIAETPVADSAPIANSEVQEPAPEVAAPTTAENDVKATPDDTIQNVHSDNTPEAPTIPVEAAPEKPKKSSVKTAAHIKHKKTVVKTVAHAKPQPKIDSYKSQLAQGPITDDGLFALKNPGYVVQLGSFNDKTNARKLVNQLRVNGYNAFMQKVADNTRVFVGPERKQNSAKLLANQIENNLHMRGIIISYKPLKL